MLKLRAEPIAMLGAVGSHSAGSMPRAILQAAGKTSQDLASLCGVAPFAANKCFAQAREAVGPLLCAGRAAVLRGRPADEDVL